MPEAIKLPLVGALVIGVILSVGIWIWNAIKGGVHLWTSTATTPLELISLGFAGILMLYFVGAIATDKS